MKGDTTRIEAGLRPTHCKNSRLNCLVGRIFTDTIGLGDVFIRNGLSAPWQSRRFRRQ